jgi:hypothetical protein
MGDPQIPGSAVLQDNENYVAGTDYKFFALYGARLTPSAP